MPCKTHKIFLLPNLSGAPTLLGVYAQSNQICKQSEREKQETKDTQDEICKSEMESSKPANNQKQELNPQWNLIESHFIANPLSDELVPFFMKLQAQGIAFDSLYFVRGPGSFMALKLIYLFAKTLEITRNIKLYAAHAFYFNENSPIKAYGKCYFVKENRLQSGIAGNGIANPPMLEEEAREIGIILQNFENAPQIQPFALPKTLNLSLFNTRLKPLYLLPPV